MLKPPQDLFDLASWPMNNGEGWDPNKKKPEYQSDDDDFIQIPYVSGGTSIYSASTM